MNQQNTQAPVALITGGAKRIGRVIVTQLHQAGYEVVIHYHHSATTAEQLSAELNKKRNESALMLQANLTSKEETDGIIYQAHQWKNRLDVLVNNASVFFPTATTACEEKDWDTLFTVNAKAPFKLSINAYPFLAKTQGSIINITDIHADYPFKGYAIYCQSKAALAAQTKALAREFAPKVRVNAVAPGAICWPEGESSLSKAQQMTIMKQTPMQTNGQPLDIAKAVLCLIANDFITGETIHVDGGRRLASF